MTSQDRTGQNGIRLEGNWSRSDGVKVQKLEGLNGTGWDRAALVRARQDGP